MVAAQTTAADPHPRADQDFSWDRVSRTGRRQGGTDGTGAEAERPHVPPPQCFERAKPERAMLGPILVQARRLGAGSLVIVNGRGIPVATMTVA